MRRTVSLVLVALAVLVVVAAPARAAKGDRSKDVAAAQRRANAAAARYAAAQSVLARAESEVAEMEAQLAAARSDLDVLAGRVRQLAVQQYVNGGAQPSFVDNDPGRLARGQAMLRIVSSGDADDLDRYRVLRDDMTAGQAALRARLAERKGAVRTLKADQAKVTAELNSLVAAQKAYEAKQAAAKRQAATARASRSSPAAATVIGSGSWVCPVQGPHSFSNDWHQPRSGGRLHQGNDILAPRGTPVVASVSGSVNSHRSSLGGLSYYLHGDDGNVYFGTHLDSFAGVSGRVSAGTVIGRVGSTGNASGGPPHLHFEIHPRGGAAVNPYPTLVKFC